jgi:hypothetical protein
MVNGSEKLSEVDGRWRGRRFLWTSIEERQPQIVVNVTKQRVKQEETSVAAVAQQLRKGQRERERERERDLRSLLFVV